MPRDPVALVIPNLQGSTMFTMTQQTMAFYWYGFCTGNHITWEIRTAAETCTSDPALFDQMYGQDPAAGTPFVPGIVKIAVSYYRDCSSTTTVHLPPPPLPGPFPTTVVAPPVT
jgi:hypothetical protein